MSEFSDGEVTAAKVRARLKVDELGLDTRWMCKAGLRGVAVVWGLKAAAAAVEKDNRVLLGQNDKAYLIGILRDE